MLESTMQPKPNPMQKQRSRFLDFTLKDVLALLFTAVLPGVIALHTIYVARQQNQLKNELRQQRLYDKFLDDILQLHIDQELNTSAAPYAFANARFRSATRQMDNVRKEYSLIFMKQKKLIGSHCFCNGNGHRATQERIEVINLTQLNFDGIQLKSSARNVYQLDMKCVIFDQVSLAQVVFDAVDFDCTAFDNSDLSNVEFSNTSLTNSKFNRTILNATDFQKSDLTGAEFHNVDLTNTKISEEQINSSFFYNSTLPDGRSSFTVINTNVPALPSGITWNQGGFTAAQDLTSPIGLSLNPIERVLFIADSKNHRIFGFQMWGDASFLPAGTGDPGNSSDKLNLPTSVVYDPATHSLIVCDQSNKRIVSWSLTNGTTEGTVIISNIACYGLAVDSEAAIYVTDIERHAVIRFKNGSNTEEIVAGNNGRGNQLNQLNTPSFVALDCEGSIYVSDTFNHRIVKWKRDGSEGEIVAGGSGAGPNVTQLNTPNGVVVDRKGNIYVAEGGNHRVTRWKPKSPTGEIIIGFYGNGTARDQLNNPQGLGFDDYDILYIVDSGNNRTQYFVPQ